MEELSELFQAFLDKGVDDHLPVFAFIEGLPMSEAVVSSGLPDRFPSLSNLTSR